MSVNYKDLKREYERSCQIAEQDPYPPGHPLAPRPVNPQTVDEQSECERGVDDIEKFRILPG